MDYIRLNSILPNNEPAIDNIDCMHVLRQSVHVPEMYYICKRTLYALLICSFYFELASITDPIRKSQYHCRETIRCRNSETPFVKLLKMYNVTNLFFHIDVEVLKYFENESNLCVSCHRYQKKVDFWVRHFTDFVTIYVENAMQERRKISAFSQTMQWFEKNQKLDAPFETAFHRDIQARSCHICRPKRSVSIDSQKPGTHKRPRSESQTQRSLARISE